MAASQRNDHHYGFTMFFLRPALSPPKVFHPGSCFAARPVRPPEAASHIGRISWTGDIFTRRPRTKIKRFQAKTA
jgi:hypothetical protein